MEQIKEDYVSFETAKLLKEKGFDELCYQCFDSTGSMFPTYGKNSFSEKRTYQPTQALVLKWLRIKHGIHVWPSYYSVIDRMSLRYIANYAKYGGDMPRFPDGEMVEGIWHFGDIGQVVETNTCTGRGWQRTLFDKPEEATEAAIQYTLKNLI